MNSSFYQKKYLKYKSKYLSLKNQIGGELLPIKKFYCYNSQGNKKDCLDAGEFGFTEFEEKIGFTSSQAENIKYLTCKNNSTKYAIIDSSPHQAVR